MIRSLVEPSECSRRLAALSNHTESKSPSVCLDCHDNYASGSTREFATSVLARYAPCIQHLSQPPRISARPRGSLPSIIRGYPRVCYFFRRALDITKHLKANARFICHHDLRVRNPTRKSGAQKQAATWLIPEQIEQVRDACLTNAFPTYLQGRNETIITLLADTGLRVSELVALDWDHLDLDADPAELYLPGGIQKGTKRDAYLDLERTRRPGSSVATEPVRGRRPRPCS